MTMDEVEPGTLDEAGDEKARSFNTDELTDVAAFISTDMTAADVQTVIDEVNANGGGTIVWKRGTHTYTQNTTVGGEAAAIELKSNIDYVGRGYGTHIIQDEKDINVFACDYDDTESNRETAGAVENITVENMRLDGNKDAFSNLSTRQVNNVLWLPFVRDASLSVLWIEDVYQHGIHPDACVRTHINDVWVRNPRLQGIHMATRGAGGTTHGPLDSTITRATVTNPGAVGLSIVGADNGQNCDIVGSTVVNGGDEGMTNGTDGGTIRGCAVHGAVSNAYRLVPQNTGDTSGSVVNSYAEDVTGAPGAAVAVDSSVGAVRNVTAENCVNGVVARTAGSTVTVDGGTLNVDTLGVQMNGADVMTAENVTVEGADTPYKFEAGGTGTISECIADGGDGSIIELAGVYVDGLTIKNSTGFDALRTTVGDVRISVDGQANSNVTNLVKSGGADNNLVDVTSDGSETRLIEDNGTRTRWDGVIGGGPLGGVDISTITGASDGDEARTTGASAAPADVIAVFDGVDWIYPTKGGAVTPA